MRSHALLVVLFTLLRISSDAPGIGINLSSGYATISASYGNDTYIDIAKIEGGDTYRAYMLSKEPDPEMVYGAKYCPFSDQICNYWPFKTPRSAIEPMLKALITAAEVALEMKVDSVAVSVHDKGIPNDQLLSEDVISAFKGMGIQQWDRIPHVAIDIAQAMNFSGICSDVWYTPDDPEYHLDRAKTTVTVEYTRTSLTAGLWEEECGILECLSRVHAPDLGSDALEAYEKEERQCHEPFVRALRGLNQTYEDNFAHSCLKDCKEMFPEGIGCEETYLEMLQSTIFNPPIRTGKRKLDAVLLLGEQAGDEAMVAMVRQVLTEQFSNGEEVDLRKIREFAPDPSFAGSRAAAKRDWQMKTRSPKEVEWDHWMKTGEFPGEGLWLLNRARHISHFVFTTRPGKAFVRLIEWLFL